MPRNPCGDSAGGFEPGNDCATGGATTKEKPKPPSRFAHVAGAIDEAKRIAAHTAHRIKNPPT